MCVLLQPDLLVIGPCSAGLRHRTWRSVKDMNGLAEMERSQVTYVTLVFVHSRHTEHVLHQYSV